MGTMQRVTLSLPAELVEQARKASQGNLSRYTAEALRAHIEAERQRALREALIAGYTANAAEARAIAEEFRYADYEATVKHVPPSPELESEDVGELPAAR